MTTGRSGPPAALIEMATDHRLTLVVAAAGWGKSTLLRGLGDALPSITIQRPATGWTPFTLARALVAGIAAHTGLGVTDRLPAYPTADSSDDAEQVSALATSVCDVADEAVRDDTWIVIDDADVAEGDPLERFLELLVLAMPPRVHLVLACRRQPNLRIARLRASGEVARITAGDLAVHEDDVATFGLEPDGEQAVAEIVRATGGWPLAVHLAAQASRRHAPVDHAELVERLLAPNAVLFDFLADDVVAGLSVTDRDLLILAAHLPELSADLLAEIGRGELADSLRRLSADQIFLEPVAGRPGYTRARLLGRAFIRRALPPPPRELLAAAVASFLRAGELEHALVLCADLGDPDVSRATLFAIGDVDRVGAAAAIEAALQVADRGEPHPQLVELRGDVAYRRGAWDEALRHYNTAASQDGAATTRLARKRAGLHYLRGRLGDAEAVCAAAEPHLDGSDPADEARLLAWAAVVRWARGDGDGCAAYVDRALALAEQAGDDRAFAAVYTAQAMLAALNGDLPGNLRLYERALGHAERAGDVAQIVRIRTNRGSRLTEEGYFADAVRELDAAISAAELAGYGTFSGLAYSNRGEAHLALGNLQVALADLRRAHDIYTRLASPRILYPLSNMGFVQLLRGQRSEAISLFNEAVRIAEGQRDAQGLAPALIGLARALAADDPEAAAAAAQRAIEANHAIWLPHAHVAAGVVALRLGDRERARGLAIRATQLAGRRHDRPALAEALLLAAEVDDPPAASLAEQASRLWRDLGNPIGEARAGLLLAQTVGTNARYELVAHAERLLHDAGAWGALDEAQPLLGARASSVSIATLGGFRVSRDGSPIDVSGWGSRKARDLVKLLVARRGAPVVRDEVAELLWPDEPDRSARRLSALVSTVRLVFDPTKARDAEHYVGADHDTVWLVRDHVDIDVERFLAEAAEGRRLLAGGETAKGRARLADAAARYLGEFCADDPYADWAAGLRALAKHTFVDSCFELAKLADADGEHSEAIRYWLRIIDVDAYDEDAHLGMINSLLAQRRHGEARRAYRDYSAKMAELDLETAPFPA